MQPQKQQLGPKHDHEELKLKSRDEAENIGSGENEHKHGTAGGMLFDDTTYRNHAPRGRYEELRGWPLSQSTLLSPGATKLFRGVDEGRQPTQERELQATDTSHAAAWKRNANASYAAALKRNAMLTASVDGRIQGPRMNDM